MQENKCQAGAVIGSKHVVYMCRFAVLVSGTLVYSRGEETEEAKEVEEYEATETPGRPPMRRPSAGRSILHLHRAGTSDDTMAIFPNSKSSCFCLY